MMRLGSVTVLFCLAEGFQRQGGRPFVPRVGETGRGGPRLVQSVDWNDANSSLNQKQQEAAQNMNLPPKSPSLSTPEQTLIQAQQNLDAIELQKLEAEQALMQAQKSLEAIEMQRQGAVQNVDQSPANRSVYPTTEQTNTSNPAEERLDTIEMQEPQATENLDLALASPSLSATEQTLLQAQENLAAIMVQKPKANDMKPKVNDTVALSSAIGRSLYTTEQALIQAQKSLDAIDIEKISQSISTSLEPTLNQVHSLLEVPTGMLDEQRLDHTRNILDYIDLGEVERAVWSAMDPAVSETLLVVKAIDSKEFQQDNVNRPTQDKLRAIQAGLKDVRDSLDSIEISRVVGSILGDLEPAVQEASHQLAMAGQSLAQEARSAGRDQGHRASFSMPSAQSIATRLAISETRRQLGEILDADKVRFSVASAVEPVLREASNHIYTFLEQTRRVIASLPTDLSGEEVEGSNPLAIAGSKEEADQTADWNNANQLPPAGPEPPMANDRRYRPETAADQDIKPFPPPVRRQHHKSWDPMGRN